MNLKNSQQKSLLDKKLVQSLNGFKIPKPKQFKYLFKVFSQMEKRVFLSALFTGLIAIIFTLFTFYQQNFLPVADYGGEYTEGLIGAPQYINPILSQTNDVDSDLSRLIFSGLMRYDTNLEPVPDLAESYTINDAKTEYTFVLKENLTWHDGMPVTADDVVFTVHSIQDPNFRSPLLVSLRGVQATAVDLRTIKFVLPEAYPSFLEVLTFGILPQHIWQEIPAVNANLTEYNLKPIGAGPWKFSSLTKDRLGNIKSYEVIPYTEYAGTKPYLDQLTFKFYPDFQTAVAALNNHTVDGISFLPKEYKREITNQSHLRIHSLGLPQYTAIFFNQKQNPILGTKAVRQALQLAIDRNQILTQALQLEGAIIDGPILPTLNYHQEIEAAYDPEKALALLTEAGWKGITPQQLIEKLEAERAEAESQVQLAVTTDEETTATDETSTTTEATVTEPAITLTSDQEYYLQKGDEILEITLTTVNQPENTVAANLIKEAWEYIGVKVNLQIIEAGKIGREIIKPRNYQALLFGIIVGSSADPYPFWHSSQTQDPGLNLAGFSNRNADTLLEEARTATDENVKREKYQAFQTIIDTEIPAIFLYNPTYTYVVDEKIKNINVDRIIIPADRFNNSTQWYIRTKRIYHPNNQ